MNWRTGVALKFLPGGSHRPWGGLLEEREAALLETLSDRQRALWEAYRRARSDYMTLYGRALFQAVFALSQEVG